MCVCRRPCFGFAADRWDIPVVSVWGVLRSAYLGPVMFSVELICFYNKYKIQYRSYKWTTAIIKVELSVFIMSMYYHLSANGPLWYRGLVFSLISHSDINWVLQVSVCRIRPLLSDAKIIAANMPDFGVEGWWKIRIIFICSRICSNPLF